MCAFQLLTMDEELKPKHNLKLLQNSCLLHIMLVDQRYIFSSIWHRYFLFTPLVTFFFF